MCGFSRRSMVSMRPEEERGVIVVPPVHTQSRSKTCLCGPVVCCKALYVPATGRGSTTVPATPLRLWLLRSDDPWRACPPRARGLVPLAATFLYSWLLRSDNPWRACPPRARGSAPLAATLPYSWLLRSGGPSRACPQRRRGCPPSRRRRARRHRWFRH